MSKLERAVKLCLMMGACGHSGFVIGATTSATSNTGVQFEAAPGPPPGFSDADLDVVQSNYVSLYYGNLFLGNVLATYDNNTVTLGDLSPLIKSIPGIINPDAVAAALKGKLPTNESALCTGANPGNHPYCSPISPDVAGVIFNPNTYVVTIFVNPKYLNDTAVAGASRPTIPNSTAGLSYIANNSFSVATSTGSETYSLNNVSMFGFGNNAVNITSNLTENNQTGSPSYSLYTLQTANVSRLSNGKYYQVGMLTPLTGGGFLGGSTILGASVQNYGILPSTAQGNPIVVFLPLPSQVAIYKNGYLISTQSFNAGKQNLDTTAFPAGSYDITLKITNNIGQTTTQTQFFVKQDALPPQGSPNYQVSVGMLQSNANALNGPGGVSLPTFSSVPLFTYSELRKVGTVFGLQSVLMTTFDRAYLAETLNYYGVNWQISPGALASNNNQFGWLLNLTFAPVNFPDFQFSSNNQKISNSEVSNTGSAVVSASAYSPVASTQFQSTNTLNWTLNEKTNASVTGSYTKNPGAGGSLQYGLTLSRSLYTGQTFSLTSSASIVKATGQTPVASLQLSSSFSTVYDINVGVGVGYDNANTINNTDGSSYSVYKPNYNETLSKDVTWGPNESSSLLTSANLNQGYTSNSNNISFDYTSNLLAANLSYTRNSSTQYTNTGNGNLQSSSQTFNQLSANILNNIAITSEGASSSYTGTGNSAVMAKVYGPSNVASDVYINGQSYGTIPSNSAKAFFLPPYASYQVTIQPGGSSQYAFDSQPKAVTLYTGNVAALNWTLSKQYILFAQIVDAQDKPLENLLLLSKDANTFNTTDENGYIQAGIPEDTTSLSFKSMDGTTCDISLNATEMQKQEQNGLVVLDNPVVCTPVSATPSQS